MRHHNFWPWYGGYQDTKNDGLDSLEKKKSGARRQGADGIAEYLKQCSVFATGGTEMEKNPATS